MSARFTKPAIAHVNAAFAGAAFAGAAVFVYALLLLLSLRAPAFASPSHAVPQAVETLRDLLSRRNYHTFVEGRVPVLLNSVEAVANPSPASHTKVFVRATGNSEIPLEIMTIAPFNSSFNGFFRSEIDKRRAAIFARIPPVENDVKLKRRPRPRAIHEDEIDPIQSLEFNHANSPQVFREQMRAINRLAADFGITHGITHGITQQSGDDVLITATSRAVRGAGNETFLLNHFYLDVVNHPDLGDAKFINAAAETLAQIK